MKKNFTRLAVIICAAFAFTANMNAQTAKTWDFTILSKADSTAFQANWITSSNWWYTTNAVGQNNTNLVAYADLYQLTATKPLYTDFANKTEAQYTKGLHFGIWIGGNETTSAATKAIYQNFKIQSDKPRIYLAAANIIIVIPNLVAGDSVAVTMASNDATQQRYLQSMNLDPVFVSNGPDYSTKFTCKSKVVADGNVVLRTNGGVYVYDITLKDKDGNVLTADNITTGIDSVVLPKVGVNSADPNVYDLNGRKMGQNLNYLPKGIYIINGKKVIK